MGGPLFRDVDPVRASSGQPVTDTVRVCVDEHLGDSPLIPIAPEPDDFIGRSERAAVTAMEIHGRQVDPRRVAENATAIDDPHTDNSKWHRCLISLGITAEDGIKSGAKATAELRDDLLPDVSLEMGGACAESIHREHADPVSGIDPRERQHGVGDCPGDQQRIPPGWLSVDSRGRQDRECDDEDRWEASHLNAMIIRSDLRETRLDRARWGEQGCEWCQGATSGENESRQSPRADLPGRGLGSRCGTPCQNCFNCRGGDAAGCKKDRDQWRIGAQQKRNVGAPSRVPVPAKANQRIDPRGNVVASLTDCSKAHLYGEGETSATTFSA